MADEERFVETILVLAESADKAIDGLGKITADFLENLSDRLVAVQVFSGALLGEIALNARDPEATLRANRERALEGLKNANFIGMAKDRAVATRARVLPLLEGMFDGLTVSRR